MSVSMPHHRPSSLAGKVALVTGAGTRVGQAIALELGAAGMNVCVHYNASSAGAVETERGIAALGGTAWLCQADLSDRRAARALVDQAVSHFGGLDLLVLSAASFEASSFADLDDDAWDRSLLLNAGSQFSMAHQAAPALRANAGSIVFITCASTQVPMRGRLPYVVSKAATKQLMRTLALELAPLVRVNAVAPGTVQAPDDMTANQLTRITNRIPLGRTGEAADVAQAVRYLAEAPFVTGHELMVDGGRTVAGLER